MPVSGAKLIPEDRKVLWKQVALIDEEEFIIEISKTNKSPASVVLSEENYLKNKQNLHRGDLNYEKNLEESSVKIISANKILSNKIEVGDFVKHFRNRLSEMKNILQTRAELTNLVSVNKIFGT